MIVLPGIARILPLFVVGSGWEEVASAVASVMVAQAVVEALCGSLDRLGTPGTSGETELACWEAARGTDEPGRSVVAARALTDETPLDQEVAVVSLELTRQLDGNGGGIGCVEVGSSGVSDPVITTSSWAGSKTRSGPLFDNRITSPVLNHANLAGPLFPTRMSQSPRLSTIHRSAIFLSRACSSCK